MPDQDVVVAIAADSDTMQAELDAIFDNLLPAFQSKPLPADAAGRGKLKEAVVNPGSSSKEKPGVRPLLQLV